MTFRTIHTVEARGNFRIELLHEHFNLRDAPMRRFLWQMADELTQMLEPKGIRYPELRNALVPQVDKAEIALLFDSASIESGWYGRDVHSHILPLLNAPSSHSARHGDLLGEPRHQDWIRAVLNIHLRPSGNAFSMVTSNQIFCVYLNNVSPQLQRELHDGLMPYRAYIGYADMTYTSQFKTYLSRTLASGYLKHGRTIIQPHPDDVPPAADENTLGYPFEASGLTCRSVPDSYYGVLLSYKIECPVLPGDETDTLFSTNVISDRPTVPAQYTVEIDEAKFQYLKDNKTGTLKRLGVLGAPKATLQQLIQAKLNSNYIYSMSHSEQFNVSKFNILLELVPVDGGEPLRTLAAFEYQEKEQRVRLITMF